MLDIDDFKKFNDSYGHPVGDGVLVDIAGILEETTRDLDICARYGGEEFSVILPQTGQRRSMGMAERIRSGVEKKFQGDHGVTVSLGVATCPLDADDVESLVGKADKNLYESKRSGKNRVTPER
jgi:diguanylate cyclase (GGDEF)-like protein